MKSVPFPSSLSTRMIRQLAHPAVAPMSSFRGDLKNRSEASLASVLSWQPLMNVARDQGSRGRRQRGRESFPDGPPPCMLGCAPWDPLHPFVGHAWPGSSP